MKKRFSDEQIISILREAEAGVSARELCRKHAGETGNMKKNQPTLLTEGCI
ncbi:transposase IS3/IS911 family protein [Erwinia tracheiphila PSU-1]|nr:transposase IS3/IS911 family protein [Erwinia tracheiphila PSU-1]